MLVDERSAVFLPLRGQVHHPLGTGLHQSLQEETHTSSKCECPARFDDVSPASSYQTSLRPPTWSCSRLSSASGSRSIVFFFTCSFSSLSEFPSSLCFNSSNTCTKTHHTCQHICVHSFCARCYGSPHLLHMSPSVLTAGPLTPTHLPTI